MFNTTKKLIVAALAAAVMLPTSLEAQSAKLLQKHPEAKKMLEMKAKKGQAPLLMQELPAYMQKTMPLTAAKPAYQPFASAQKSFVARVNQANANVSLMAPASVPATMYTYLNYNGNVEEYTAGFYSMDVTTGDTEYLATPDDRPSAGAVLQDGQYRYISAYAYWFWVFYTAYSFDTETWECTEATELPDTDYSWYVRHQTSTPDGSGIFGQFYNAEGSGLVYNTVDWDSKTLTEVGAATTLMAGMTSSATAIYGLGVDGNLYTINEGTGEETLVGSTGISLVNDEGNFYYQSIAFDRKNNVIYWCEMDNDGVTGHLYSIDPATAALTLVHDWGTLQYMGAVVPTPAAEDAAPAAPADLAVSFEGPATSGKVSFTAPALTFAGETLTGDLTYTVLANGATVLTGNTTAGAAVVADVTVPEGQTKFNVYCTNAAGDGAKAKLTVYVGYDTPKAPENVALAINEGAVSLTWDACTEGVHGGYMGEIKYNVYRDETLVSEGQTANSFTETLEAGTLHNYIYAVEAVNTTQTSAKVNSNGVVFGNAMTVPVSFDLSTAATDFDMMTILDNNQDGSTWVSYAAGARYTYNSVNNADDYLFSPQITLTGGRTYVLTYTAWSGSSYWPERLEVLVGQGTTAEAMTQTIVEAYEPQVAQEPTEVEFTVPADGNYNVAFHCVSDADELYLYLSGFSVEAGPLPLAPAAVENLTATPGAQGALEATIAFNAPSKTVNGSDLTAISTIVATRNGEAVKVFTNPTPGEALSFTETELPNGTNEWTIIAYNEYENGVKSKCSCYVGQDVPAAISNGSMTDEVDHVILSWDPVTTGANGGYVDPDDISYEIYTVASGYVGELLATITDTTYSAEYNTNEGDPALLQYCVRTVNSVGTSGYVSPGALLVGAPAELPLVEDFTDGSVDNYLWYSRNSTSMSLGVGTAATITAGEVDGWLALRTQKVALTGAMNPEFIVDYAADAAFTMDLVIYTRTGQQTIATKEVAGGETGSFAGVIPAAFVSEPWVYASVEVTAHETGSIDIYSMMVRDVLDYNMTVDLTAPASVTKGENIVATVAVNNEGAYTVSDATVTLTAGDKTFEQAVPELGTFQGTTLTFNVPTSIFDEADEVTVAAKVNYALDLKPEDNEASTIVTLKTSTATGVEGFTAEENEDGSVTLSWNIPEVVNSEITEDWESYEGFNPFPYTEGDGNNNIPEDFNKVGQLGNWTAYDMDGMPVYGWSSSDINWPYMGDAMAFCEFNVNDVYADQAGVWNHSGNNALLCMDGVPGYSPVGATANDDWLVSPVLPGMAQTMSFWATELTDQYGHETFEVYYSTTGNAIENFTKLAEGNTDATVGYQQFSYDLPEGTTYFAIRVTSADVFGMLIDDITFTAGSDVPSSYIIYRDQEEIATVTSSPYVDQNPNGAAQAAAQINHTYSIVAVYPNGQKSAPVSTEVVPVGIKNITVNAEGIEAYNAAGVRMQAKSADELGHGVFMVNGQKVVK